MFSIEFSRQSEKFLKDCEKELSLRIREKIKQLLIEPVPHNAVRVQGEERTFRIRIGDYRVLYEIYWKENILLIVKIDKRPRAYD